MFHPSRSRVRLFAPLSEVALVTSRCLRGVFPMRVSRVLTCACGAFVLLVVYGLAIAQQEETPEKLAARIDKLIEQLDDDDFQIREKAEAGLVEIGTPAVAKVT